MRPKSAINTLTVRYRTFPSLLYTWDGHWSPNSPDPVNVPSVSGLLWGSWREKNWDEREEWEQRREGRFLTFALPLFASFFLHPFPHKRLMFRLLFMKHWKLTIILGPKGEKRNYIKVITDKVNLCREVFFSSFLCMEKNGNIREVKFPVYVKRQTANENFY